MSQACVETSPMTVIIVSYLSTPTHTNCTRLIVIKSFSSKYPSAQITHISRWSKGDHFRYPKLPPNLATHTLQFTTCMQNPTSRVVLVGIISYVLHLRIWSPLPVSLHIPILLILQEPLKIDTTFATYYFLWCIIITWRTKFRDRQLWLCLSSTNLFWE